MNDAATPFKRFANLRQFLDLEAQVDASEDSEEDSNTILEDDFLDDHDDGHGSPSSLTRTDRFDAFTEHEANQDAANAIRARQRQRVSESHAHHLGVFADTHTVTDPGWEETILLIPSMTDPDLWKVDVQEGKEPDTVALIFDQAIERGIPIQSAFCRDYIPGIVYIEGPYSDCVRAIENLSTVRLHRHNMKALIQIVDVADRAALLRSSRTPSIKASSLVRIRNRSRNRNDLAFVSCVDGNSVEVFSGYRSKRAPREIGLAWEHKVKLGHPPLPKTTNHKFIHGLRVHHIPFHLLQTSFVNPTSAELDALSQSPLYNPTALIDTAVIASSASAEVSQRFTRAILAARKDLKVMSIGAKVVVVSGPFSGIHGTIVDVLDHNIVLQIRLQGQLPSLEVPLSHLASFPSPTPGRLVQVTSGPYKGLNGLLESLGDEHAIFQPSDQCTQLLDVACRSVARDYTVGDHIKVVEGLHKGTSGFVVKNDLWQLEVFVKESMSMVSVCTDDVLQSPPEEANNTEASTPTTTRLIKGPERFKDLEVTVIGKNQWKGRIGAIVGHSYPSNTDTKQQLDDKDLIFKVRIGNDLSINAPTFKPSELQELRTKLPVLVAAKLPPSITQPPRIVPPSHQRAHTPEGDVDDDIDDYLWRPDAEELARQREPHWLLKVPMNFKVQVAIRGTTEGDINGVHRDAYRAGRYEGMTGSVVVTNALQDERSSVNVRIQDETNRRFKIMYLDPLQEPSVFQVGSRVLIIGRDLSGANAFEGQYGHISACVYPLPVGQHLVFIQPNFYAYFDIKSLCFSGDMVEWQGNIH